MLHQIKAPKFYTGLGLQKTVLNPLANSKIQGLFRPLSVFQVRFTAKFISSTYQACANPEGVPLVILSCLFIDTIKCQYQN